MCSEAYTRFIATYFTFCRFQAKPPQIAELCAVTHCNLNECKCSEHDKRIIPNSYTMSI